MINRSRKFDYNGFSENFKLDEVTLRFGFTTPQNLDDVTIILQYYQMTGQRKTSHNIKTYEK